MKLTDFDKKNFAPRALEENYKLNFDVSKLTKIDTQNMLRKIRTLANEAKSTPDFQKNQVSPSYMKLVFMEQALVEHYNVLLTKPTARIVFENEEVEKSQVVLAAQDMVDTIQKMLEDIGQRGLGVYRKHQHFFADFGQVVGCGGGKGRFSQTTLATEHDVASIRLIAEKFR